MCFGGFLILSSGRFLVVRLKRDHFIATSFPGWGGVGGKATLGMRLYFMGRWPFSGAKQVRPFIGATL